MGCVIRIRTPPEAAKPVALMLWLVKLIVPIGGTCLDPFAGSGSTGVACVKCNRGFIGIEKEPEYVAIAERRLRKATGPMFQEDVKVQRNP